MDDKTFKMIRRNSLHVECPEGLFDDLEREEDGEFEPERVTHSECMMLNRVLSDKTKIPRVCNIGNGHNNLVNTGATTAMQVQHPRMPELVRRMSGGVPGAYEPEPSVPRKKELGGPVSMSECQTLSQFLRPSVGGAYLMPMACSHMLKQASDQEREEAERENAKVYQRLKRRMSQVAVEDYPPTFI